MNNKVMIGGIGAARAKSNRYEGFPPVNYKVVWYDPKDKEFGGTAYHKSLEDAKEDVENMIELGYKAKLVKGDFTRIYYSDRRHQI